jgi:hypothetical protein
MPHTSNIKAFLQTLQPNHLLDSYRILVAVELALKDAGLSTVPSDHDVPAMLSRCALQMAASGNNALSAQITAYETKLRADLAQLWCTNAKGTIIPVPARSYPYVRYTRHVGEWGGVSETLAQSIVDLAQTCNSLLAFLLANATSIGVKL